MIAQGFGFARDFLKERNNSAYFRLKKMPCEFKEQARPRHPGEICGLAQQFRKTVDFGIATVDHDDVANGFNQVCLVMLAQHFCQLAFAGLVVARDTQLEQFMMIQRRFDFVMQILAEALLTDGDDRLQFKPMALGA